MTITTVQAAEPRTPPPNHRERRRPADTAGFRVAFLGPASAAGCRWRSSRRRQHTEHRCARSHTGVCKLVTLMRDPWYDGAIARARLRGRATPPHERTMPGHPPGSLSTMRNRRHFDNENPVSLPTVRNMPGALQFTEDTMGRYLGNPTDRTGLRKTGSFCRRWNSPRRATRSCSRWTCPPTILPRWHGSRTR